MTQDYDDIDIDLQPPPDKLYAHNRRQLSAMLDGELSPDQARFMLRRLQHDAELAECWERWQVCGDVLRGRGHALLPADFSKRVADAIAAPATGGVGAAVAGATPARRPAQHRLLRWGGGALAASFALVALFMARQLPEAGVPVETGVASAAGTAAPLQSDAPALRASSSLRAQATALPAASMALVAGDAASPASTAPGEPGDAPGALLAAGVPLAVAVAEVPRRSAPRGGSRSQSQRAAVRRAQSASDLPLRAVAAAPTPAPQGGSALDGAGLRASVPVIDGALPTLAALPAAGAAAQGDPLFGAPPASTPRPWPRAVLPGLSRSQPFAAGLGQMQGFPQSDAFAPFQPRLQPAGDAPGWRGHREPVEGSRPRPADAPTPGSSE